MGLSVYEHLKEWMYKVDYTPHQQSGKKSKAKLKENKIEKGEKKKRKDVRDYYASQ